MRRWRALLVRLASLFGAGRSDRDIDEELRSHRDMLADEYRRVGLAEDAAARAAAAACGSLTVAADAYRDRRGLPWLEHWARDSRLALRSARRSPVLFLSMVLVLGLGVGVSATVATIADAAAWRALPVPEPARVVKIAPHFEGRFTREAQEGVSRFSLPEIVDYRAATRALESLAGITERRATWRRDSGAQTLHAAYVTGDYFRVLRLVPSHGRFLAPSDAREPVAVISHRLWIASFGGRADAVGRPLALDRAVYMVIGVAPESFTGSEVTPADVWLPLEAAMTRQGNAGQLQQRNLSWLDAIGRLAPGASIERARREGAVIAARWDAAAAGRRTSIDVARASRLPAGLLRSSDGVAVWAGGSAVAVMTAILLLICGSNAAGLLLARGATRQKEIALRVALGAGRARIAQQLMVEVALVAAASAVVGSGVCAATLRTMAAWLPEGSLLGTLAPDARVLAFAASFAATLAALFGLAPLRQALRVDCLASLKGETSVWGVRLPASRLRRTLVATQVAVSLVLLAIAALLGRAVGRTSAIDPGFPTRHLYIVQPDTSVRAGAGESPAPVSLAPRVRDALAAATGVEAIGLTRFSPFGGRGFATTRDAATGRIESVYSNEVDEHYFAALGVAPVEGRLFTAGEKDVAIVNRALARRNWGGERAALGQRLQVPAEAHAPARSAIIIGVIPAIQTAVPGLPDEPTYYLPLSPQAAASAFLIIRGREGTPVARLALDAIRAVDGAAIASVVPFDQRLLATTIPARLGASIAAAIGVIALLVAAAGIHGIVAHAVTARTHEIGVHLALGASNTVVLRLILGWTLRGVMIGLVASTALLSLVLVSFQASVRVVLFGLNPLDPIALLAAVGVLMAVTIAAAYHPVRRALGIGPLAALRSD
jgi:predicted permease